jgi:starch synthase (maltosyl-transferring)
MKEAEKMIIYNLFPLLAGKFRDWEKHMLRASRMGFNWIFVNPIQRPGISGSLYSIADYFAFNPLFVDSKLNKTPRNQLTEAINAAADMGLRMMIDLVINHCSVDSDLLKSHPEWFMWESQGRVTHPSCDEDGRRVVWKDLATFDHRNSRDREGLYRFFLSVVNFLIELGFTGFRCDAAYQVPRSLWERLIRQIRKDHPEVLFFAETLGCQPEQTRETARGGFDYIFNSSKWWDFYGSWLMKQYVLTREMAPSIGFPESHDTLRLCEELQGNLEGVKQRYLFTSLFSAGVMMPMGFEFGFRKKLHVVKTRPEDWEETGIDLTTFVASVNEIKAKYSVFQEESPTEIDHDGNPYVLLMWKASIQSKQEALMIINKDIHNKQTFYADNLYNYVQSGAPLVDVSPEYRLDYIHTPFHYDLRPGQGIILVAERK